MYRLLPSKWKLSIILISLSAVKFCGGREGRDPVIESEGHRVTVQFMSGPHNNGRGLFLSYTSSQHTGNHSGTDFFYIFIDSLHLFQSLVQIQTMEATSGGTVHKNDSSVRTPVWYAISTAGGGNKPCCLLLLLFY